MICVIRQKGSPFPTPLCAFWHFIPPPDNQSDDSIFLLHELQSMLQPGHQVALADKAFFLNEHFLECILQPGHQGMAMNNL